MSALREEFLSRREMFTAFQHSFFTSDEAGQKEWYQKIYDADKVAFFSAVIGYMDNDLISVYADKAEQDGKTNFFSAFLNYMQPDMIKQYAEKYYAADDVTRFAVMIPYMAEKEQQDWLKKAQADKKNLFSQYYLIIYFDKQ